MNASEVKFSIPKPCHVPLSSMSSEEKGYYCSVCTKNIKDFRFSSREIIINELSASDTNICGIIPSSLLTGANTRHHFSHWLIVAAISFILVLINPKQGFPQKKKLPDYKINWEKSDPSTVKIAGKIIDKETKQPVEFANVQITRNGIVIAQLQTDLEGDYSASLTGKIDSGTVDVEISYAGNGFTVKDIAVVRGKITRLDISMPVSLEVLTIGIIIKNEEPLKDGPSKKIKGKELERMRYSD